MTIIGPFQAGRNLKEMDLRFFDEAAVTATTFRPVTTSELIEGASTGDLPLTMS